MRHARAMYNLYVNLHSGLITEIDRTNHLYKKMINKGIDTQAIERAKVGLNSYKYYVDVVCQYYYLACFDCRDRSKRIQIGDGK